MSTRAVGALVALTAALGLSGSARADDLDAEPAARKPRFEEARGESAPKREEILVEAPGGDPSAPKSGFCWACVLVGGGTLLVIGAIPLAVRATTLAARADAVDLGRAALSCGDGPSTACDALSAADTDFTPWAVSAGVVGGLGLATIVTGALLGYAVPARDGGGITWHLAPTPGVGGVVGVRGAF